MLKFLTIAFLTMKHMRRLTRFSALLLGVLLLTGACTSSDESSRPAWLLGTWKVVHNPENDSRDDLIFHKNGSVTVRTETGDELQGKYAVEGRQLKLVIAGRKRPVDVMFTISDDHTRLIYPVSGAYYSHTP